MSMNHYTRLRAYQLGNKGASFSISVDNHFTLVEARYNDKNSPGIRWELNNLGKKSIDVLHITSWDEDHCRYSELLAILQQLRPALVECPGYAPHTDNGKNCLSLIKLYVEKGLGKMLRVTTAVVREQTYEPLMGKDLLFNPVNFSSVSNDNSVVKLFRVGSF